MKPKGTEQNGASATAMSWSGPVFGLETRHNMPGLIENRIACISQELRGVLFGDYSVTRQ